MTGLLHVYAFIPLVLVIILMAWIVMVLHANEDPPAHHRDKAKPRDQADNPDAPGPKASG